MTQSSDCDTDAQVWAEHLATTNTFEHAETSQGENLYVAYTSEVYESAYEQQQFALTHAAKAIQSWYDEIKDYNWGNPDGTVGFS